jgi:probable rRNA maturation factor
MARLNREYLGHEGPTDVISFPLEDPGDRVVGDIYIGVDQAARQAEDLGVTAREETVRLALHGLLHVLGWDHPEDGGREESEMFRRQEELVGRWGDGGAGSQ